MWNWHEGMGWWMVFGSIWMILFWAVIIGLVVWGVTRLVHREVHGTGAAPRRDPLDIARERYARGEITKEEFERIKRDLA